MKKVLSLLLVMILLMSSLTMAYADSADSFTLEVHNGGVAFIGSDEYTPGNHTIEVASGTAITIISYSNAGYSGGGIKSYTAQNGDTVAIKFDPESDVYGDPFYVTNGYFSGYDSGGSDIASGHDPKDDVLSADMVAQPGLGTYLLGDTANVEIVISNVDGDGNTDELNEVDIYENGNKKETFSSVSNETISYNYSIPTTESAMAAAGFSTSDGGKTYTKDLEFEIVDRYSGDDGAAVIASYETTIKVGIPKIKVKPIFEGYVDNLDGTYNAYFGYKNESTDAYGDPMQVTIPFGTDDNKVSGYTGTTTFPSIFAPGRTPYYPNAEVEITGWDGENNIVWTLDGRTATAGMSGQEHYLENAKIYITADDGYELYVDGNFIGESGLTTAGDEQQWDHLDGYWVDMDKDDYLVAVYAEDRFGEISGLTVTIQFNDGEEIIEEHIASEENGWVKALEEYDGWYEVNYMPNEDIWEPVTNIEDPHNNWVKTIPNSDNDTHWVWSDEYKNPMETPVWFRSEAPDNPINSKSLNLTSMCIDQELADSQTRWRITNDSGVDVDFTYEVYGTNITGSGTIGAEHTSADRFSNPFYIYVDAPHPATLKIYWGEEGQFSKTKASSGDICEPETGTLVIDKDVEGNASDGEDVFDFMIEHYYLDEVPNDNIEDISARLIQNEWMETITASGITDGTIDLPGGWYMVTELDPSPYTLESDNNLMVEIIPGQTTTVDFLNSYNTSTPPTNDATYRLSIEKEAVEDEVNLGQDAEFIITVTNTGNRSLTGINVVDDMTGLDETISLSVGESETFEVSVTTTEVGALTNTASASGSRASFKQDSATVTVVEEELEDEEIPEDVPDEEEPEEPTEEEPVEEPTDEPVETEIEEEQTPLDLPDTGVAPTDLFFGLGALVSGLGVFFTKKRK